MKIAIIGDTHARVDGISRILAKRQPDHIIHAGDFYADAKRIAIPLKIPFDAVAGNCDLREEPAELQLELAGQKIYVVHGHQYGVKRGFRRLERKASGLGVDIVIFGHTHRAYCEKVAGLWLLNPGSPSLPHDPGVGTYIWLTIQAQEVVPTICKIRL